MIARVSRSSATFKSMPSSTPSEGQMINDITSTSTAPSQGTTPARQSIFDTTSHTNDLDES
jgi:hypothetical protein